MTTSAVIPGLADRADVHKSCKSLESIANALNDYCQAADSLALTQKKLAKALREMHNLKGVSDLIANAMATIAGLFETLGDVDQKFVKVVDKESDSVSSDLKKWFKKLAKEEKGYDDKIAAANLKIRQAGQTFERKAKWKDKDAADEHTRYLSILNTVGPEMSQEKYNHSLFVTQKHTAMLYATSSSLSRVADAEWLRSCECVKKFSALIGRIGELRAYLEGSYSGGPPEDLSESDGTGIQDNISQDNTDCLTRSSADNITNNAVNAASDYATRMLHLEPQQASSMSHSSSVSGDLGLPQYSAPTRQFDIQNDPNSVRSLESLSAFPSPPKHFPLPPFSPSGSLEYHTPNNGIPRDPPAHLQEIGSSALPVQELSDSPQSQTSFPLSSTYNGHQASSLATSGGKGRMQTSPEESEDSPRQHVSPDSQLQSYSSNSQQLVDSLALNGKTFGKDDIGKEQSSREQRAVVTGSPVFSTNAARRTSVSSISSRVAAIRERMSSPPGPSSPRPRDIPRLPQSVSDLANKYTPVERSSPPASPNDTKIRSPKAEVSPSRRRDSIKQNSTSSRDEQTARSEVQQGPNHDMDEGHFAGNPHKQQQREGQQNPSEPDGESDRITRDLERDITRMLDGRNTDRHAPPTTEPLRTRPPRPYQYSRSTTNLISTPMARSSSERPWTMILDDSGRPNQSTSSPSQVQSANGHAPVCGCQACSVTQYKNGAEQRPTPYDLRPPEPPISLRPEKPKGWMRRLSMPVMDVLTPDSKKNTTQSLGLTSRHSRDPISGPKTLLATEDGRLKRQSLEHSVTGGISNVRTRKISFGRR